MYRKPNKVKLLLIIIITIGILVALVDAGVIHSIWPGIIGGISGYLTVSYTNKEVIKKG